MNAESVAILQAIRQACGHDTPRFASDINRGHAYYAVSVPALRRIAKRWANAQRQLSVDELCVVHDALFEGESYEEKRIAGILLQYVPRTGRK